MFDNLLQNLENKESETMKLLEEVIQESEIEYKKELLINAEHMNDTEYEYAMLPSNNDVSIDDVMQDVDEFEKDFFSTQVV